MSGTVVPSTQAIGAGIPAYQPPNMLAQVGQYQQIANQMQQNRLSQAQTAQAQQQTANAGVQGQQLQQDLTSSARNFWGGAVSAYSYLPKEMQTRDNYNRLIDQYEAMAGPNNPAATSQLENFRKIVDNTEEGGGLQNLAHQVGMAMAPPNVQQQMAGTQGTINNGQQTFPVTRPGVGMPNAGNIQLNGSNVPGTTPQGGVQNLPAPAWQTNFNPATNQTEQKPSPAVGTGGQVAPPPIPGNGSFRPTAAPPGPPQAGTPTASNGGYNTSAPIGTTENIQANIGAYNSDAGKVPDTMDRIRNNGIALQAMKLAFTGKGTADWYALGQRMQSWGLVQDGSAWAKNINNQATAEKYTAAAIANSPAARSDQSLAEVAKGSASTSIPNPVAQSVLATNIAKDRMFVAQVRETQDKTKYAQQQGEFPVANDRRAYEWDLMTPEQQQGIRAELQKQGPAAQKAFAKSLGIAQKYFFPGYVQAAPAGQ